MCFQCKPGICAVYMAPFLLHCKTLSTKVEVGSSKEKGLYGVVMCAGHLVPVSSLL